MTTSTVQSSPTTSLVVIGASAGGIQAARTILGRLPAGFPAPILIVIHIPANMPSMLPEILSRSGKLPVHHAVEGMKPKAGEAYVAPPGFHLLIRDGQLVLGRGPRENGHRPAVDALFRTAANWAGKKTIGVILSGMLDDGAAGIAIVSEAGGVTLVQDPVDAEYGDMPENAIARTNIDAVLPAAQLADRLVAEVLRLEGGKKEASMAAQSSDMDRAEGAAPSLAGDLAERHGVYSCPECAGALWEVHENHLRRYECRVGHNYSPESLLREQSEALEAAFWTVLRSLEESASLYRRLLVRSTEATQHRAAEHYQKQLAVVETRIRLVRNALLLKEIETVT